MLDSHRRADQRENELDVVFGLLRNARRRHLLSAIDRDGEKTVDELATVIAERERANGRETSVEAVRTSLIHAHLPKLATEGVVDYDAESDAVALSEKRLPLDRYLADACRLKSVLQPSESNGVP